jgi:hypothetical protein
MSGERELVCGMVFDRPTATRLRSTAVAAFTREKAVAAIARCLAVAALARVSPIAAATRRTATASRLGLLTSRPAIESAPRPIACPDSVADSALKCAKGGSGALLTACAAVDAFRYARPMRLELPAVFVAVNAAK